jgi:hypothetical protein
LKKYNNVCDVLVLGGGTAGVIAAIQAARAGANTTLVEINTQLGGTITTGGVAAPAYFFVGNRQIVGGIGWELVKESLDLSHSNLPDFNDHSNNRPSRHVPINPYIYALLAEEKCLEAGVKVHYQEMIQKLERQPDGWTADFAGNMLSRRIVAKEIIDCTGDAVAVRLAGGECTRDNPRQPGTMSFHVGGYDLEKIDMAKLDKAYREAVEKGELKPGDYCYDDQSFEIFLKNTGGNMQHIFNAESSDSELNTEANFAARASILRMLRFLHRQPGFEKVTLEIMRTTIGIRDSWRIAGETTVTTDDYLNGKIYDDAIAWTYYFIDIHHEKGVERRYIPEGKFPTIPFGALIPRGLSGILTAGRTISSDRAAFSALRVQASCMAMGQAVGAAAALAAASGIPSRDIPVTKIRSLLLEHGACVPGV